MNLILFSLGMALAILPTSHAQRRAIQEVQPARYIVIAKGGITEEQFVQHFGRVHAQMGSKPPDQAGIHHLITGSAYGLQGYSGEFSAKTLDFIKRQAEVAYIEEDSVVPEPHVEFLENPAADTEPGETQACTTDEAESPPDAPTNAPPDAHPTGQQHTLGGRLSWGQGYSTLLGKGLQGEVVIPLSVRARGSRPPVLNEILPVTAYNFTAPSADWESMDYDDAYFTAPDPDDILNEISEELDTLERGVKKIGKRTVTENPDCAGTITVHNSLVQDYNSYLHTLDVSASMAISAWGQSAAISGTYLNQIKMSKGALTFVATIEVERQQGFENGQFNMESYTEANFHKTHGDRWVKGYRTGGRLMARLIFTAKDQSKANDVKLHAEVVLRQWGVKGEISASARHSMEQLEEHASVDISVFQEGELGAIMSGARGAASDQVTIGSASTSFNQVKQWADLFIQQACNHAFAYRPVLDEYTTLRNFPSGQLVNDYGTSRLIANRVLRELVKLSEFTAAIRDRLEHMDIWQGRLDEMDFAFWTIVDASKGWVQKAAENPLHAWDMAESVVGRMRVFNLEYKGLLKVDNGDITLSPPP